MDVSRQRSGLEWPDYDILALGLCAQWCNGLEGALISKLLFLMSMLVALRSNIPEKGIFWRK